MRGAALAWLIALLGLSGGPAAAETFRLRSGEHANFSRLVLDDLPEGGSWTLGRAGSEYELRLALEGAGFDTGQVYRLIPKTRLLSLEDAGQSTLRLRVAENHHAIAFETETRSLVIDIRAGPPPAGSRFEDPVEPQSAPVLASAPAGTSYRPAARPPPRLELFWGGGLATDGSDASPPPAVSPLAPSLPDPRVVQAEADLMMQLGRAAAQGLVEIDVPDPRALVVPSADAAPVEEDGAAQSAAEGPEPSGQAAPAAAKMAEAAPAAPSDPAGHLAVHSETSIDRAMADQSEKPGVTSEGETCLPATAVDIAAWGDDRAFSEQLADAQTSLLGEFDQPDPAAVERTVKLYLYHGFGAEARATAAAFGLKGDSAALLLTLAEILDDGHADRPGPLAGMADCDTAAALWAVMAEPRITPGATVDHGAVLRAFSALPLHLRRALGPGLVERFIEAGAPDTARAIRDAILRAAGDHGPGLQMIDARLDLARGDSAGAEAALGAVIEDDGPLGPEALILLIDTHLAEGRPVPPPLTAAAAALAFEHRDSPLGKPLARAQVLGLASTGAFAAASEELARTGPRWAAEERRVVARELARMLTDWPDDAVFLARYFADRDLFDRADPPVDLRLDVAGRLLDAGFAAEASLALGPARMVAEGRMIAARAALIERDTGQALALLAGMVGAGPAALRAEALGLAGDHAAAAEAYRRAGLPERAVAEQWRAGDLEAVRGSGTEPQRAVLALDPPQDTTGTEASPAPDDPVSLAGAQALLEASRAARDAWSALLAAPGPVTTVPGALPGPGDAAPGIQLPELSSSGS
ncbi:hypothetical protein GVY41_14390 [Frigidibacter albus]|uniref:Uncharacterized protein n=1 Tax=Frigidibacter albus TaxID=1465486 RepID=A0A6L8VJ11_9RHOB|nr:hypothetical protein [Frigidibacter albus]MZQ90315.1 hypothetical protein [Frigidibacter albus]NBE32187.1 hypothetical protein [Frigidibacter albus]GGH58716.1 hypothetical protein GCM10011341_29330 [Frigidibacter albus]